MKPELKCGDGDVEVVVERDAPADPETFVCSRCDGAMTLTRRLDRIAYAGVSFTVTWIVWECPVDGNTAIPPHVHRAFDRAVLLSIIRGGPVTGSTFKCLRGFLKLKAVDVASLLELTPETISRWETGASPVAKLAWLVVAAMAFDHFMDRESVTRGHLRAFQRQRDQPVSVVDLTDDGARTRDETQGET